MSKHLTYKDTRRQSLQVFGQFGEKVWIPNAKENAKLEHQNTHDLQNTGLGKTLVLVAMGASLEEGAELLKKYRSSIDIMVCDKGFVPLMEHGVKPDYVMICDANIPAAHYEKYVLETKDIKLIATPYANTLWTKPWLGPRYFYVNKDAIESEKVFEPIMGEGTRIIPASSNVSNAMVVFMTGCDEIKRINWSGYEKFLLIGYDYSWRPNGNYYAWANPHPKRHYMHHATVLDIKGDCVFTSNNLIFSTRWLHDYVTIHRLPVINCSERGLLHIPFRNTLENELKKVVSDSNRVRRVRESYRILQSTTLAQVQAKDMFERAREDLWQLAAMQK